MDALYIGLMVLLSMGDERSLPIPCVVTAVHEYLGERSYEVTCFNPTANGQPVVEQWRGIYLRDDRGTWDNGPHLRRVQP